jgi:hypothetical protein
MLETTLMVQGTDLEVVGNPARTDVMEELARITRGKMIRDADLDLLRSNLSTLPERAPLEKRLRLWAHPLWITLLIMLMTIFWIGRKAVGSV